MLPSINLDDEIFLAANKICHERPDCLLPDKFETVEPPVAEGEPKLSLSISLIAAKFPLDPNFPSVRPAHHDCPSPASLRSAPSPRFTGRGKCAPPRNVPHHNRRRRPIDKTPPVGSENPHRG